MASQLSNVPLCSSILAHTRLSLAPNALKNSTFHPQNLVRTAISSIVYLRNLFPEDCFQDKKLTGLTIRTLLPTRPESQLLINWLEQGVFDALDKHYLSDVVFAVYAKGEDRNTLLECYQFHVDYPEEADGLCLGPCTLRLNLKHNALFKTQRQLKIT